MAYTRIHAIKTAIDKAIAYICNPDKTEGKLLVDSFGCAPESAHHDFLYALSRTNRDNKKLAYHLIQSFAPGEVDPEEAHRIGTKLADRLLEGKYSYVIATHTDKGHVHSHIIFSAADNIDHKKYNDCRKTYRHIRNLSDELCREHGLSVIEPKGRPAKSYYEWKIEKIGKSWKARLIRDIRETVYSVRSYEEFISEMRLKGYEVKGEGFGENAPKYISFRAPGRKNFIRGYTRTLGKGFTKEEIRDKIQKRIERERAYLEAAKEKQKIERQNILKRTAVKDSIIDTTDEKFKRSPGLTRWAKLQNLKTAAQSYASAESIDELKELYREKSEQASLTRSRLLELESNLKRSRELLNYVEKYSDNRPFHAGYKKTSDPDRYMRMHETQLILFDGARRQIEKMGLAPEKLDIDLIKKDISEMEMKHNNLRDRYRSEQKEASKIQKKLKNIEQYLSLDYPELPDRTDKRSRNNRE